jgi:hypothetical protein
MMNSEYDAARGRVKARSQCLRRRRREIAEKTVYISRLACRI